MRKIATKIANKFNKVYRGLAVKSDGPIFCLLFNFSAAICGKDVRFIFDRNTKIYKAISKKYSRYFYEKKQNWNCYINGISERGQKIGSEYFCNLINFSKNDLVIDCGANVGDLKLFFDENNLDIRYVGIEPSPKEYVCLKRNNPESQTLNIGLWSEDSSLEFYVSSQNADSSFIKPRVYTEIVSIPTKRLDSIFDERIKLLKIEAEGAEPEALMGCENLLGNIEYISADLGFERGIEQESTLAPVTNFLLQNGFDLVTIGYPRIVALYKNQKFGSS